jgi:hypothetical protein
MLQLMLVLQRLPKPPTTADAGAQPTQLRGDWAAAAAASADAVIDAGAASPAAARFTAAAAEAIVADAAVAAALAAELAAEAMSLNCCRSAWRLSCS